MNESWLVHITQAIQKILGPGFRAFIRRIRPEGRNETAREQGQAAVRIAVAICLLAYLTQTQLPIAFDVGPPTWLVSLVGYLGVSVLVWVLARRGSSAARRLFANVADAAMISYLMIDTGPAGIPLFMLYLWMTLGNGFRFGLGAMFVSAVLSLLGFSAVVILSDVWNELAAVSAAVVIALTVLPAYAAHLIHQLATATERAEEASAAKSRFLARMSHELRTPLNGILGTTELLAANKRLTREDRSLLEVIKESVNVSLRQIDNVLDFGKIEAGKLTIDRIEFDLHEVLNRATRLVRNVALEKSLRLMLRIDPAIPYRLIGDPHHLHEVLLNLLSNAVKFTEVGHVSLEARLVRQDERSAAVRFDVHDTGIGIDADAQRRIFEAFSQEDTTITRRRGGTGLGATISEQLVKLMGGRLQVTSVKGEGSTFYAEIQFARPSTSGLSSTQLAGFRALLVSENAAVREYIGTLMRGCGALLTIVPTIAEATGLLGRSIRLSNPIHAVLMDSAAVLTSGGGHRGDDFLNKASLSFTPAFLVGEVSPGEAQLRKWGYASLVPYDVAPGVLFNALHSSGLYNTDAERGVIRVEPWVWGQVTRRRARLLIADDNRTNLMILRKILETASYEVDAAEGGEQALEMMLKGRYRAAVLDMHMPGMDGIAVIKQYRMLRRSTKIPVVMLTANATVDAKLATAESGADAYLTKPATASAIVSTIEKLLEETEVYDLARRYSVETATEDIPALNTEVITELDRLYNDPTAVTHIIREFECESRRLLNDLTDAVAKKNHAAFCDLLHALKGNCANVGALRLVQVCHDIEGKGLLDFRREGEQMLRRLDNELIQVTRALRELTAVSGPGSVHGADFP
jgi:two-component system sensor histidine kinase RpfC